MGDDLTLALGGGEDYELLFCARPGSSEHELTDALGVPVRRIGRIIKGIRTVSGNIDWCPRRSSRMGSVASAP